MRLPNKTSSIHWRIVFIYFLLVFIAMTISGVFIMKAIESYQMESVRKNITKIKQDNMKFLQEYEDLDREKEKIQADILAWSKSLREEIIVINSDFTIIASGNPDYLGRESMELIDQNLLIKAMSGKEAEEDSVLESGISVKNMIFPIIHDDKLTGAVLIRADLTDANSLREKSKQIFLKAMLISLIITVILGFFIAKSISVPINELTEKAEKMSEGDFSQNISKKSDDEIGRLADMFNLLREKLDFTLEEISSEKSKLEAVISHMSDGLLAIDMNKHIILANLAVKKIFSIEDDNYDKIDEKLEFSRLLEECKEGGKEEEIMIDGLTYAVRYDRFRYDSSQDVGMILLLRDITERQKIEEFQRDFVANVSHELKTPLTAIKGYAETLLDRDINDENILNKFTTVICKESDRMSRLVSDLLFLSRLDYKRERWQKKQTELVGIVKTAAIKIEMIAQAKNQTIKQDHKEQGDLSVFVDRDRIEQVILNILSNSIKYSQENTEILLESSKEGEMAAIRIKDSGIGIAEKDIERIFERFYRVDKARSRDMGGTGLGLSIAKQIMEEHDGRIELKSKLNEGTEVVLYFPLVGEGFYEKKKD